ncbi:hypothetical protein ACFWFQ_16185 [Nocardia salmonicida]|uniref:hypothetical protein n=1 Tax=Nocardia salmonicida TaxID=53431 RepID=UPI00364861E7
MTQEPIPQEDRPLIALHTDASFVHTDGTAEVVIIKGGEQGYYQTDDPRWPTLQAARTHCDEVNRERGLSEATVNAILLSSHTGRPVNAILAEAAADAQRDAPPPPTAR